MDRRKKVKTVLIVLAVCAALALLYYGGTRLEQALEGGASATTTTTTTAPASGEDVPTQFFNGREYRYNTALSTLLILGIDDEGVKNTYSYRNHGQSDFLLLAVFDQSAKRYTLLQINRDTMADMPVPGLGGSQVGTAYGQLALAHTYGSGREDSCRNTAQAVSDFLYGAKIDHFFSIRMDAIPVLNDLVGGVTVTIEDDFSAVDKTLVKGETITLHGDQATHFVRARSEMTEDATNLARMRRQRTYMEGLTDSLRVSYRARADAFALEAYAAMDGYTVTDCTADQLASIAQLFSEYQNGGIVTPEGEAVLGEEFMEFHVDEESLQQIVIDLFYLPVE